MVKNNLSHPEKGITEKMYAKLNDSRIIAWSGVNLQGSDVSTGHLFELKQIRSGKHLPWPTALRQNEIIEVEAQNSSKMVD